MVLVASMTIALVDSMWPHQIRTGFRAAGLRFGPSSFSVGINRSSKKTKQQWDIA